MFDEVRPSKVWILTNDDLQDEDDLSHLLHLMYVHPEYDFYIFVREGVRLCSLVQRSLDSNRVLCPAYKGNYYAHPQNDRDFVCIRPDEVSWDWEQELVDKGERYIRYELKLSDMSKRDMQIEQHIKALKDKDSNPLELKPNLYGVGVDIPKLFTWIKKLCARGR